MTAEIWALIGISLLLIVLAAIYHEVWLYRWKRRFWDEG